jgi:VanZ family protein
MDRLSSRGVRIRRERLIGFRAAWLLLAIFIAVRSAGRWSPYEPGVWAPLLIRPADVARNVAVYVLFGMLGMLAVRRERGGVLRITIAALLLSLAVEALQLYTTDRVASLTDIASAAVGSSLGAGAVRLFRAAR